MHSQPRVDITPITPANWRDTLDVRVGADQLRFIADHQPVALIILAKAYLRPRGYNWLPLALISEGVVVGVAALAHATDRAECEMLHFAIDLRRQGRGLGGVSLRAMFDHIRATLPTCQRLLVTVHPDNRIAQNLYHSAGFVNTGATTNGEPVLAKDLWDTADS